MGWIHDSRMTQTYVHLSGRDQDNAILKAYGIDVKDEGPWYQKDLLLVQDAMSPIIILLEMWDDS